LQSFANTEKHIKCTNIAQSINISVITVSAMINLKKNEMPQKTRSCVECNESAAFSTTRIRLYPHRNLSRLVRQDKRNLKKQRSEQ
jgi:hypothetical protein